MIRKLGALGIGICIATMAFAEAPGRGRKAQVELLSASDSIVAGQPLELALRFRMSDGWHIYWKNPGDAGLPPTIKWQLPDGFSASALEFPVPTRHVAPGNIVTNIFEEEVALLTRVSTPSTISGKSATIAGSVKYLICKETCVPETAEVKIELPVSSPGATPKIANEVLFARAKKALPPSTSKYLTVTPSVSTDSFVAGKSFEFRVKIDVAPGIHIQSHQPLQPSLIKTDLLMERTEGLYFEKPVFPEGKRRPMKALGEVSEYSGTLEIKVPASVDDPAPAGAPRFAGLILYQACNDQGTCFPPSSLAFAFPPGAATPEPAKPAPPPAGGTIQPGGSGTNSALAPTITNGNQSRGMLGWLFFAFLGGLILNVMPCVLPVISIKVLSLVQQAEEEPRKIFRLGMTFVAGIIISFIALALVVIGLKTAGRPLGWGFQFQSPAFLVIMSSLIFLFGLSLFGVFTISLPGTAISKLAAAEGHEGYFGAFMKGLLGTVLATPCTAPYLGPALGWAWTARNDQLVLMFTAVGLGMASPFILLCIRPNWLRFMPRPGIWMEHFKQFMGFLLMGTVVWLLYALGSLIGPVGLTWTLAFLAFLGLAAWLVGKQTPLTPPGRRFLAWLTALGVLAGGWWVCYGRDVTSLSVLSNQYAHQCNMASFFEIPGPNDWDGEIPWQPWSKGLAEQLAAEGYTVYVDYTADWCANCLTNKKTTLESETVRTKMAELCIVPLKADNTREDADIFADLTRFGRAGVPLNIIYPAGRPDRPIVLPELLVGRSALVLDKLHEAGPSDRCGPVAAANLTKHGT